MGVIIASSIAGISTVAFIALCFVTSYRVLSGIKKEVMMAAEQVQLHRTLHSKESGSPNVLVAKSMLDTSGMICGETVKDYNRTLKNPAYRIPGFVMGFRLMAGIGQGE